jgi:hypothetical protein
MGRFDILREIESLDPERDNQRIMHLSFGYEFSWDSIRALEIALYRTYCVPSISGLLDRTGEFYRHAQRRYDDTAILMAEICEWGYESGRGKEALERVNWAHGHFKISNDDFTYVLSTFLFEPIRWIDAFGWRKLCDNERLGYYYFWRGVGRGMGIRDIPAALAEFEGWAAAYEERHFRFAETNQRIGTATRDLFASWFPRFTAPLVHYSVYALLDQAMLDAFGFPRPLPGTGSLLRSALRWRGRLARRLPPRRRAHFFTDHRNRTYPDGYEIGGLGPPRLVAAEQRRAQDHSE